MKRIMAIIAAAICTVALTACGGGKSVNLDTGATADILASTVNFSENLTSISQSMLLKRYGLDKNLVEEAAGYAGTQAVVDEVAVFKTTDTEAVLEKVNGRIDAQRANYASYAPNELPKLDEAAVYTTDNHVIVCVSEDTKANVQSIISELTK